jgi:hypothetical protein
MVMETTRNNATGEIRVRAVAFTVVVSEDCVKVVIDGATVHEWKPGQKRDDAPSPRAATSNRKRGSR